MVIHRQTMDGKSGIFRQRLKLGNQTDLLADFIGGDYSPKRLDCNRKGGHKTALRDTAGFGETNGASPTIRSTATDPLGLPADGFFGSTMQQQAPFCRFSIPLITAAAHPTPVSTDTAPTGQLRLHAPHSMQASRFRIRTRFSAISSTPWGQTSRHMPQPVQVRRPSG